MIAIGEKLNSSIPNTLKALKTQDTAACTTIIKKQAASGAVYLDINTALTCEHETETMLWLVELALQHSSCGIMLDSPNPDILAHCIPKIENRKVIINSITLDVKYDGLIELAKKHKIGIVCLPLEGHAIPHSAQGRLQCAASLIEKLRQTGIPDEDIYMDALVESAATNQSAVNTALETITLYKQNFPNIHSLCGLSNVSFGLPGRAKLNAAFLTMALQHGMDSAIIDITSDEIKSALHISNALLGKDDYCMEYIDFYRKAK